MGYCVSMDVDIHIPFDQSAACLEAINALFQEKRQHGYSWVNYPISGKFQSLDDAFKAWRYSTSIAKDGGTYVEYFTGEKWGDDQVLYEAIAPFVADAGCDIRIRGEDGEQWGYDFREGKLIHMKAVVQWVE
jgi:hypothetical protein